MAKEVTEDLDVDNLDGLDDFEFDDFDLDIDPMSDSRKPVEKMSSGFTAGIKNSLTDPDDLPRKLKKVLPDEYGSSIELAEDTVATAGRLYDTVREETRTGIKDFKKASKTLLSKHESKLPKKISDRLNKLLEIEEEENHHSPTKEQIRNSEVENNLSEIFGTQLEIGNLQRSEDKAEEKVRDVVRLRQHKSEIGELFAIRKELTKQSDYQDQVTARFQRKSLELQYRQLFVAGDLLKIQEDHSKATREALQSIVKNTALPEYQKIELTEVSGQMLRDSLLGGFTNKTQDYLRNFGSNAKDKLISKVKEKAAGFSNTLSSVAGSMDMVNMASEMGGGFDPYAQLSEMAGSHVGGMVTDRVSPFIRTQLEKNEKLAKLGLKLNTGVNDLPRILNSWAQEEQSGGGGVGFLSGIRSFLAESLPTYTQENKLEVKGYEDSDRPAIFDNLTRRSIVEIIPGYLSRIHGEIASVRNGMGFDLDPSGRLTYNLKRGEFSTFGDVKESVFSDIFKPDDLKRASAAINNLVSTLDTNDELSITAIRGLSKYLLNESLNGRELNIFKMADSDSFEGMDRDSREEVANLLKKRFEIETEQGFDGTTKTKYNDSIDNLLTFKQLKESFNKLTEDVIDPRPIIQGYLQLGYKEMLDSTGLIKETKSGYEIDRVKFYELVQTGALDTELTPEKLKSIREEGKLYREEQARLQREKELDSKRDLERKKEMYAETFKGKVVNTVKDGINKITPEFLKPKKKEGEENLTRYDRFRKQAEETVAKAKEKFETARETVEEEIRVINESEDKLEAIAKRAKELGGELKEELQEQHEQLMENNENYSKVVGEAKKAGTVASKKITSTSRRTRKKMLRQHRKLKKDNNHYSKAVDKVNEVMGDENLKNLVGSTKQFLTKENLSKVKDETAANLRAKTDVGVEYYRTHSLEEMTEDGKKLAEKGFDRVNEEVVEFYENKVKNKTTKLIEDVTKELESNDQVVTLKKAFEEGRAKVLEAPAVAAAMKIVEQELSDTGTITNLVEKLKSDSGRLELVESLTRNTKELIGQSSYKTGTQLVGYGTNQINSNYGSRPTTRDVTPEPIDIATTSYNRELEVLEGIFEVVKGESEGVTTEVSRVIEQLKVETQSETEQQQTLLLSAILSNVEALAQMSAKGDKKSWFNILDIGKKTKRMIGKAGSSFGSFYLGGLKMAGGGMTGAGKVLSGLGGSLGRGLGRLVGRKQNNVYDVYLKDGTSPTLTAEGMRKGKYYDGNTGKVIKSIDDLYKLEGDIFTTDDLTGKAELVATVDQLRQGLFDRFGQTISGSGIIGSVLGLVSSSVRGVGRFYGALFSPLKLLGSAAKSAIRSTRDFLSAPVDIYVKGETTPRILANVMRNGGYVSGISGKVIYKVDEIDGPVHDREGNLVLSLEDMKRGLTDVNGRPLGFFKRQLSRILSLAKIPLKAAKIGLNVLKRAGGFLGRGFKGAKEKLGGTISGISIAFTEKADEQIQILTEIRDILKESAPKRNKYDASGDGLRDGSWRERMASRKTKKEKAAVEREKKPIKSMTGSAAALGAAALGIDNKKESEDSGTSAVEMGAGAAAALWAMGKAKSAGGAILRGGGKVLAWGSRALGGKALLAGGAKVAAGAGTMLAGVVSAPVLLGAVAVTAVAVGGYLLYKYLTKRELGALGKLRVMQYGLNGEDKDTLAKIYYLEDKLEPFIKYKGNDVSLEIPDDKKIDIAKGFGIDINDQEQASYYVDWLVNRFIPIYLTHHTALKNVNTDVDFSKVDEKLKPHEKLSYLEKVKDFSSFETERHAYSVVINPIIKSLVDVNETEINRYVDKLESEIKETVKAVKPMVLGVSRRERRRQLREQEEKELRKNTEEKIVVGREIEKEKEKVIVPPPVPMSATTGKREGVESFKKDQQVQSYNLGSTTSLTGNGSGGLIDTIPLPTSDGNLEAHKEMLAHVSKITGVDAGVLATFAGLESSFNSKAKASTSSAKGLFQFIDSTWREMIEVHGHKYGIKPGTSQFDPRANALMAAEYLKGNYKAIEKVKNSPVTDTDLYLAHFLGRGGARSFLSANPNSVGFEVFPNPARANPSVFYENGKPRTLSEIYKTLDNKVKGFRDNFGVNAREYAKNFKPREITNTQVARAPVSEPVPIEVSPPLTKPSTATTSLPTNMTAASSTMESSVGLREATTDLSKVNQVRAQRTNLTLARDRVVQENSELSSKNSARMLEILSDSLKVQSMMETHLSKVVKLLSDPKNSIVDKPESRDSNTQPKLNRASAREAKPVESSVIDLTRTRGI